MRAISLISLFIALSAVLYASPLEQNINVSAGVPYKIGGSTDLATDSLNYIIERSQYVVSINKELAVPNWAAWYLCKTDFGKAKRFGGQFVTDTTLPLDYYRVKHSDYTNSGYDRGHLVRSEERTASDSDNYATFYLTNIIPQTPDLNRLVWLQFERYCHELCQKKNRHLYVVAGGVFHSGLKLKGKVAVPDSCWKVVLMLDSNQSLVDVNNLNLTIAVIMPNVANLKGRKWFEFITTVSQIEQSTGYDFFSNIPSDVQNVIENRVYSYPEKSSNNKKETDKLPNSKKTK